MHLSSSSVMLILQHFKCEFSSDYVPGAGVKLIVLYIVQVRILTNPVFCCSRDTRFMAVSQVGG